MTYDQKCHDLAIAFLSDFPALTAERRAEYADEMAKAIQQTIEEYIDEVVEAPTVDA